MAILNQTQITGKVEAVLANTNMAGGLATTQVEGAKLRYAGMEGDGHGGLTRAACVRTRQQYEVGTEIKNTRQLSVVSVEDLAQISENMGVDGLIPEWLGANLLISGIPDFTLLPPSSRLIFSGGASIVVDMENQPCKYPGDIIDQTHNGFGALFANKARGLRGVTAWVEREGMVKKGDSVELHIPPQRIYAHATFK